ncbi:MAG: DNA primase [Bacilli bacterium]|nr:DNA primase [Bacilli bacterium]
MNNNLINEIRSKTDIVDIIGERIPLVARGKNFFGVCPFHDDSNPSLCVSREKQIYTCFSCHATGNVYTFLMNYDSLDFKEALKYLGERVNVDVSNVRVNKKVNKFDKLYDAYNLSLKYYQNNLLSKVGESARKYLLTRKIDNKMIKEFEIGLSLNKKDDLTKLLTNKKYDLKTLNNIGLSNDDRDIYNDRIMFPLYDVSGKVVGFSGRIYKDSNTNKYLNTKETDIFKKGEMLYHYHIAKEEARLSKSVIVMEGFMDVIRASSIGIKNTVALMGTALTKEQINLLKRLSNNIILCLDGDSAGIKATLSIGDMLEKENLEIKVISLPDPDDPDTYILNNGEEKFKNLIDSAINFSDFKLNKLKENYDFRSDQEKSEYINKVLEETKKLTDPIRIELTLKKLAKEFDIGYNTLEMRFSELKKPEVKDKKVITKPIKKTKKTKYEKAMEQILYSMLNNEDLINKVSKEKLIFPNDKSRILASEINYYYLKNGSISIPDFYTYVQDKEEIVDLLNEILAGNYMDNIKEENFSEYFKVIKDYSKNEEIKRLTVLLKKEIDPIEQAKIANEIRNLRMGE